MEKSKT
jgi:hypothetical protein